MANTDRSFLRDDALGILAAGEAEAFGNALAVGVLLEATLASAPGSVSLWNADGVVTAGQAGTRIDAPRVLAGKLPGAVIVLGPLL